MSVTPKYCTGWNMSIMQLFGFGPKWTITCGNCLVTFKKRVPMIDYPGVICTRCGEINILPLEIEIYQGQER